MSKQLRRVARSFLSELGLMSAPTDMFEIARDCGFDIYAAPEGVYPRMVGDQIILVDIMVPGDRQQHQVARSLARWALFRAGIDYTETGAEFIAQALLAGQLPDPGRARTTSPPGAPARRGYSERVAIASRRRGRSHGSQHATEEAI